MLSINLLLAAVVVHIVVSIVVSVSPAMRAVFSTSKIVGIIGTSIAFNAAQYWAVSWWDNDAVTLTVAGLYAISAVSLIFAAQFLRLRTRKLS